MYVYSFVTCATVQRFASQSLQSSFFSFPIGIYMEALFINALLIHSAGRFFSANMYAAIKQAANKRR